MSAAWYLNVSHRAKANDEHDHLNGKVDHESIVQHLERVEDRLVPEATPARTKRKKLRLEVSSHV